MIQGKWQSIEDKNSFLIFVGNQKKDYYEGFGEDIEVFEISDKCVNYANKDDEREPKKDSYMSVRKSDMCWEIEYLSNDRLSLVYMGRFNTLNYVRVKEN